MITFVDFSIETPRFLLTILYQYHANMQFINNLIGPVQPGDPAQSVICSCKISDNSKVFKIS